MDFVKVLVVQVLGKSDFVTVILEIGHARRWPAGRSLTISWRTPAFAAKIGSLRDSQYETLRYGLHGRRHTGLEDATSHCKEQARESRETFKTGLSLSPFLFLCL
jgi:hypothetical protein